MNTVRIIFLGSGDAFFAAGRHQPAYLIESPPESAEGSLLLDCGSTALASLNRQNVRIGPIDAIFLSHLHGDHFGGLPFLFLHYIYIEPRRRPLKIIGPPGVENRVGMLFQAMYADVASRPLPFRLEFSELLPERDYACGGMRILPFRAPHLEDPPSFGCVVEAGGRKIVYTGDSGWTEDLVAQTHNADLFICECSYFDTRLATHLDYLRIAENLDRLGAKRIILTHLGEELLKRQQEVKLEMAYDGMSVQL